MADDLLHLGCLRQAERNPAAIAVICGDQSLSYEELVRRARRVANRLAAEGVERESVVGVLADRSIEAAIGFLGVMLAGGAYLPLDPQQPDERLHVMLGEASAKAALFGPQLDQRILGASLTRLSIVEIVGDHSSDSAVCSLSNADAHNLGYVIFTSGSSGKPKGVMIEHRGAAGTIADINERFDVGPSDRILCLSSFGFDLSVYDLFGIWAAGGAVVIPTPREACNPSAWLRLIRQHRITIWNSVPALLEVLVAYAEETPVTHSPDLASLRLVMLSGDWIPVALPDRFRRLHSGSEIVSLGGATEASIWSVLYPIADVEPTWKSIPYGRGMRGQSVYVLDAQHMKCAAGEVGEIHIGGAGVARGYVGQPELTRLQFVRDPFSPAGEERLYKTGDLGRLLPDGNVELLGRKDCQVKINGQRIELGEIESVLTRHPHVREAAVVAPTGVSGRKRLVAFVVASDDSLTPEAMCDYLRIRLPKYMLPTGIHFAASLPLTSNGKVDRKKLQDNAIAACCANSHSDTVDDRVREIASSGSNSALENELAELWQVVFQRDNIEAHDDFFQLGGDSLTAAALAARIQDRLGLNVTMGDLIQFPTIRRLASFFQTAAHVQRETSSVVIKPGRECRPVFFVPPIFADLFGVRQLALRLPPELPIIGLQPRGLRDGEEPDRTIAAMASYYLEQVRRHQPRGQYHLVGYSLGGTVAFEMASMLVEAGETPPVLIMIDAPRHGRPAIVRASSRLSKFVSARRGKNSGRSRDVDPEQEKSRAKLFQAHHAALCHYRPRRYPAVAHWLRAADRPGMIKRLVDDVCRTWDWQAILPESPLPKWIPGTHDTIFERPYVDNLASHLSAILQATPSLQLPA